jgi:Protein of unknown function (DUF2796)
MVSHRKAVAMKSVILCVLAWLPVGMALAAEAEHREHGPHEHGVAELNVALDGNVLWLELSSPAMNIVGFEHAPSNAEQKAAVDAATQTLKDGARVFATSPDADCDLTEAKVTTDVEHPEGDHHDAVEHDEPGKHAGEVHSEFQASYRFECATPDALEQLEVHLFDLFPGTEEIDAQVISGSGQSATELTAAAPNLSF